MRRRVRAASFLLTILLVAALVAFGSETPPRAVGDTQLEDEALGDCQPVGQTDEESLELCFEATQDDHGRFVLGTGTTPRELDVAPPGPTRSASAAGKVGHWAWAALAPDRGRILAQWSAECEVPIAFLVDVETGTPEPVTGEDDWAKSPESMALGWTTDGRAIVFLPSGPACGTGSDEPGIYLYSSPGRGRLLLEAGRSPIRASLEPRTVEALRAAGR
jgi:hypothetical protein